MAIRLIYLAAFTIGLLRVITLLDPAWIEWADVMADRVVAEAAVDGTGTTQPIADLVARHGFSYYNGTVVAPRPPGAVLVALPTLLVPVGWLLGVMAVLNVAAIGFIGWASCRIAQIRPEWGAAGAMAVYLSPVMFEVVRWGNNSTVISALIVAAWWLLNLRPRLAGALLGVAAAVKAWPALILFVLPRRVAAWMVGTGGVLSVVGVLLPGVNLSGIVGHLGAEPLWLVSYWNKSIPGALARHGIPAPVILGGIAVAAVWLILLRWTQSQNGRIGVTVLSALLISPYSWITYWFAAAPVIPLIGHWFTLKYPKVLIGVALPPQTVQPRPAVDGVRVRDESGSI